jgi:hypothetical protein
MDVYRYMFILKTYLHWKNIYVQKFLCAWKIVNAYNKLHWKNNFHINLLFWTQLKLIYKKLYFAIKNIMNFFVY